MVRAKDRKRDWPVAMDPRPGRNQLRFEHGATEAPRVGAELPPSAVPSDGSDGDARQVRADAWPDAHGRAQRHGGGRQPDSVEPQLRAPSRRLAKQHAGSDPGLLVPGDGARRLLRRRSLLPSLPGRDCRPPSDVSGRARPERDRRPFARAPKGQMVTPLFTSSIRSIIVSSSCLYRTAHSPVCYKLSTLEHASLIAALAAA